MSITSAQAVTLLEYVLFEQPTLAAANAANWTDSSLFNGTVGTAVDQAASTMALSPEGGIADRVVRFYEGALGRLPSGSEISYYVTIAEAGLSASQISQGVGAVSQATWNQIAADFTHSPEFTAALAADSSGVIDLLYHNVLGRTPAASETAYYQAQIDSGADASLLLQEFVNSPEYLGKVNSTIQQTLAGYGALLAPSFGPTPVTPLNDLQEILYTAPLAGAGYATTPATAVGQFGVIEVQLTDMAALTIDPEVALGSAVTTGPTLVGTLEKGLAAHHVAYGVYQGNTYLVESMTGTPGPTDTTVIELVGSYSHITAAASGILVCYLDSR